MDTPKDCTASRRLFRLLAVGIASLFTVLCLASCAVHGGDITAAAMGEIYNYNGLLGREVRPGSSFGSSHGDNWESCWGADGTLFISHDDGFGFGLKMPGIPPYVPGPFKPWRNNMNVPFTNHGLCRIDGDPNLLTESVRGVNLNPGIYSYTLPPTYSRDIYEVDGVLYTTKLYSNMNDKDFDGKWDFFNGSLMKSYDGGRNWYNNLGQLNTMPPDDIDLCMFPDPRMSWPAFIHYGKGGEAPPVDNADRYVYLLSHDRFGGRSRTTDVNGVKDFHGVFLARIARATLPNLDRNDVEYYTGGDGMDDANWSQDVALSSPALAVPRVCPRAMYMYAFQRYLMCDETEMAFYTAEHPWGPWTKLTTYKLPGEYWGSLACNKWTTSDGKKTWYMASAGYDGQFYPGELYPYAFLFNPVYLSTGKVDAYDAADAKRTGGLTVETDADGDKYAAGFADTGDALTFTIKNIRDKGWHIVRFQYATPKKTTATLSVVVNGRKVKRIDRFCYRDLANKRWEKWWDHSAIYYLEKGTNTFALRQDEGDDARNLMVRRLYASREATYDEGENVALEAAATASSAAPGSAASAVNDGCASGGSNEWVSHGDGAGAWAQLNWKKPVTVEKIALFDRPDPIARVTSATLTFSDGSASIPVGHLQSDGRAGTVITFMPRTVDWVRCTISGSSSSDSGLAELEVYRTRKRLARR